MDTKTLNAKFQSLQNYINQKIIGQPHLTERLLIALLADGHLLVEGPPGLAKTKAISTLSQLLEASFQRIQFTPDLLPSDITGTDIYRAETGQFEFQTGPVFHNLILADEINRAPAKVQSALLEAMAERQVSVGNRSMALEALFLVMATQNPIDQEGTYPLPEAQLDRFMMHVLIDYPDKESEKLILALVENEAKQIHDAPHEEISQQEIFQARQEILEMNMAETVKTYIVELVMATRQPEKYDPNLAKYIEFGVSPRATIALSRAARALAWLKGLDYVSPEEVQAVVKDILRHRLLLNFEAEAEGKTTDDIIDQILNLVPVV